MENRTMADKFNNVSVKKILIVKPSSLGDIFHTFPAVSVLEKAYPEAEFHWLVHPAFKSVIKYCPSVTRTIPFPRRELGSFRKFIPAFCSLWKELRRDKYDLVVDFQGLFRSAFFAWTARSRKLVGFAEPREPVARIFYNWKIKVPDELIHAVEKNIYLAETVSGQKYDRSLRPALPVDNDASEALHKITTDIGLDQNAKIIGVALGARWESKRWPAKFFADLVGKLIEQVPDLKIILLGAKDCAAGATEIIKKNNNNPAIFSLVGKTGICELVEAIRDCGLLICNDSGPMHIAAAQGIPVCAFFGPTDPEKTGPFGDFHYIFQRKVECIKCLQRKCPNGTLKCHQLEMEPIVATLCKYIKTHDLNSLAGN